MVLQRNRNQNLTEIENRRILFLCDGFRKTDLGIDLIANAFRRSIENTRLFSIFSSFIFCSMIHLFKKRKGAYSCLPSKNIHYLYSKDGFTYDHSIQYKLLLVRLHVYKDLLKLKAYKLFENSDADLSWLLFLKKPTCLWNIS